MRTRCHRHQRENRRPGRRGGLTAAVAATLAAAVVGVLPGPVAAGDDWRPRGDLPEPLLSAAAAGDGAVLVASTRGDGALQLRRLEGDALTFPVRLNGRTDGRPAVTVPSGTSDRASPVPGVPVQTTVAVVGRDGRAYARHLRVDDWTPWVAVGERTVRGAPSVAVLADGRTALVSADGPSGRLQVFLRDDAGAWTGPTVVGGTVPEGHGTSSAPLADGLLVAVRGVDGAAYVRRAVADADSPAGLSWQPWQAAGRQLRGDPAAAALAGGAAAVVVRDTDDVPQVLDVTADGSLDWSSPNGRVVGVPAVAGDGAGGLRLLATGADTRTYLRTRPAGRDWERWTPASLPATSTTSRTPEATWLGASWRPGCPVGPSSLRVLDVPHVDALGLPERGELVVAASAAPVVAEVFEEAYAAGQVVRLVRPVHEFGADDDASMAAGNTSAFNCRPVTGGSSWSQHSYGRAVDVNPVENPYVRAGTVLPPGGRSYLDRGDVRVGMVVRGDALHDGFTRRGWGWGGDYRSLKDYQHFSSDGR